MSASSGIYWIDPADCGEDGSEQVARFVERVRIALPLEWTVEVVGGSDMMPVLDPVPDEVERIVQQCWDDHCRHDGDPRTRIRLAGEVTP